MPGYYDSRQGRYITGTEAEGRQRPFDRGRKDRMAVAKELVGFSRGQPGFADQADERRPTRGAARQYASMVEAGAAPEALSARLAEDRQLYGIDDRDEPSANTELMSGLAEEADQHVADVRSERAAGEIQDQFDQWVEATFDLDQLAELLADRSEEDRVRLLDELVERFEEATGLEVDAIDVSDLTAGFDDDYDYADDDEGDPHSGDARAAGAGGFE
jgi:hypothetical protein